MHSRVCFVAFFLVIIYVLSVVYLMKYGTLTFEF